MAIKIGAALNTSPYFWINAQRAIDLFDAAKKVKKLPNSLFKKAS
jgi:plasmid maintenance system antidote protein VapI